MNSHSRSRALSLAVGALSVALLPLLAASPAVADPAPPITSIAVTDGTEAGMGTDQSYPTGTPVSIVINGQTSGTFSFTGCVAVQAGDGDYVFASTSASTFTWTAGTSLETLLPGLIELDVDATTDYYIELFYDSSYTDPAGTCADIWNDENPYNYDYLSDGYVYLSMVEPETMNLTGIPQLGKTVTVASKVPGSLVGQDFDLWACPDQTIYPNDDTPDLNGDCYGPIIQTRNGDSTQFLLGYDPARDGDSAEDKAAAEAAWAEFCGKYFIVHDYPGGGHSNWIGPIICEDEAPALAETGADSTTGAVSLAALAAMLVGGVLLTLRRRATATA